VDTLLFDKPIPEFKILNQALMHKAIIIEDELHSREFLKNIITTYCPELELVAMASGVEEGVIAIKEYKPEIIFLDIEMQTGTGFDLLQQFPDPEFDVIFTTAYDHYAIKAIKFSAIDYLLKPIEIEELQNAVKKVTTKKATDHNQLALQMLLKNLQAPQKGEQSITLATSEGLEFVPLQNIIRIEASGPYSYFFLKSGKKIMVSRHLKEYEMMLNDHGFFRAHNSHIININEVKRMVKTDGGYAVMSDDSKIGISPKKKEDFMLQMSQRLV
jgi:two-component system LytT family response regulator